MLYRDLPCSLSSSVRSVDIEFQESESLSYSVVMGNGILEELGTVWSGYGLGKKAFIVTHPSIRKIYAERIIGSLTQVGVEVLIFELPEGESSKSFDQFSSLMSWLLQARIERSDVVLALGGGVIGDLAGFAAATCLRGVRFMQVPTSLLAQVDAAIGGKTGINHEQGKNLVGSFYQPVVTYIDLATLATLPKRELRCGLAEVIKYGMILDRKLFDVIESRQDEIARFDPVQDCALWEYLIERSCVNKARVVSKDQKESGFREILNFGHTLGHAIESVTGYGQYGHGEAVALGMRGVMVMAHELGLVDLETRDRVLRVLAAFGFPISVSGATESALFDRLYSDKKVKAGMIRFVMSVKIGQVKVMDQIDESVIRVGIRSILA